MYIKKNQLDGNIALFLTKEPTNFVELPNLDYGNCNNYTVLNQVGLMAMFAKELKIDTSRLISNELYTEKIKEIFRNNLRRNGILANENQLSKVPKKYWSAHLNLRDKKCRCYNELFETNKITTTILNSIDREYRKFKLSRNYIDILDMMCYIERDENLKHLREKVNERFGAIVQDDKLKLDIRLSGVINKVLS